MSHSRLAHLCCVIEHLLHINVVLSVQFLFALLDGTSLCLHSEEQTDSGMLTNSTDFEYASCMAEYLQRNSASTQPQVREGIEAFPTLAFLQPNLLLVLQSVSGLIASESSTSLLSFVVIRTIHF